MNLLSTDKILNETVSHFNRRKGGGELTDHLDIGSGNGDLINLLRTKFNTKSSACDYTDELLNLEDVELTIVDLNNENLPYTSNSFDLVTITEVIEHLDDYRRILKDIFRVLRPGGLMVVTTPNILNLKSRFRFLVFGFHNLFGPLSFKGGEKYSTGGHISPISLFYLEYTLGETGFKHIDVTVDKFQDTSVLWLVVFFPWILIGGLLSYLREIKMKTIDETNLNCVLRMNSLRILLGRTVVLSCQKPDS